LIHEINKSRIVGLIRGKIKVETAFHHY
jgi:hypothetical protein